MFDLPEAVNTTRIEESIALLKLNLNEADIAPVIEMLEKIIAHPEDKDLIHQLFEMLNQLGVLQGAILNIAPYIGIMLSEEASRILDGNVDSEDKSGD